MEDCDRTRTLRLEKWMTSQTPWWRIDWAKYQRALAAEQERRARARFGGGIYAMAADELDAEFLVALDAVRDAAEPKARELAEGFRDVFDAAELVELARQQERGRARSQPEPEQVPQAAPPGFDPWGHVLGRNRAHTFGGQLEARFGPAPAPPKPAKPAPRRRRRRR